VSTEHAGSPQPSQRSRRERFSRTSSALAQAKPDERVKTRAGQPVAAVLARALQPPCGRRTTARAIPYTDNTPYPRITAAVTLTNSNRCGWTARGQTSANKNTMGDRSPKSVQKQASQKQSRADDSQKKKQALVSLQQATKAKAAANKKK
jgi:hypothetical protein